VDSRLRLSDFLGGDMKTIFGKPTIIFSISEIILSLLSFGFILMIEAGEPFLSIRVADAMRLIAITVCIMLWIDLLGIILYLILIKKDFNPACIIFLSWGVLVLICLLITPYSFLSSVSHREITAR
jgi:hypothetical protein